MTTQLNQYSTISFSVFEGSDFIRGFTSQTSEGGVINITGYTFEIEIIDPDNNIIILSQYGTILNASTGDWQIKIESSALASLTTDKKYNYKIKDDNGLGTELFQIVGTFVVTSDYTKASSGVGQNLIIKGAGNITIKGAGTVGNVRNTRYLIVAKNDTSADYNTADYNNDSLAIQGAIDEASTSTINTVVIKNGVYDTSNLRIVPKSNVTIIGENATLQGAVNVDWIMLNPSISSSQPLDNFHLQGLTFDCQNRPNDSAVQLRDATNCTITKCHFKNVVDGWHLVMGAEPSATALTTCSNNTIENNIFDLHSGTLEQLLIFNSTNTKIKGNKFQNNTGPSLGLWQKTYNTKIDDNSFENINGVCTYVSLSCEDTFIQNNYATNSGSLVSLAKQSDNGAFGETRTKNVQIANNIMKGGVNSGGAGLSIGAVENFVITQNEITEYTLGININSGSSPVSANVQNGIISNNLIYNNNRDDNFHAIHPGLLFSQIGGELNLIIEHNQFYDTQTPITQRLAITYEGAYIWDKIYFNQNRLKADDALSQSIYLNPGSSIGPDVIVFRPIDFTLGNYPGLVE